MVKPNARNPSLTSQESYSAVIIADLIAEVPVAANSGHDDSKVKIEETNFGYDGHMDGETSSPIEAESQINGSGISKGVILNATKFGQPDLKTQSNEKPSPTPTEPPQEETPKPLTFKDMSIPRKIAFGFSFLPSILFVLCFAVILPCNIPQSLYRPVALCVEELWTTSFNNTELTSSLQIPGNIFLTFSEEKQHFLLTLDTKNGSVLSKESIFSVPIYLRCSNNTSNEGMCIVMDDEGTLYATNASSGDLMWKQSVRKDVQPSLPVLLPDCNNDGVEEIAVAISNTKIQIIYNESSNSSFSVLNCDSVPERLMSWNTEDSSDIIFFCKISGKDSLIRVPQETWCKDGDINENEAENVSIMFSRMPKTDASNEYILVYPQKDGLILWKEDEVLRFLPNSSMEWTTSSLSHSVQNRFILDGKFITGNPEVALFSSDPASNMKITILNATDGNKITEKVFPSYGTTEGKVIHGENRDIVLLLLKKVKNDLKKEALTHINHISSTVMSFISNEDINEPMVHFANDISEEIALVDMVGNFSVQSVQETDTNIKSSLTADFDSQKDLLNIYLLSSLKNTNNIGIRKIKIANWDITAAKQFQCSS